MSLSDLGPVDISLILAGSVTLVCYTIFILAPAVASYGRMWERVAAGFLTIFMLATLVLIGIVIGGAIVWTYDTWGG